eukprot:GHVU01183448.1.p1 GENE.GHVU01183448.1~~GHVU01183448.1.p1  ORF type:complete len:172 (+),score=4.22 GHVU01183448.1:81-596(+)
MPRACCGSTAGAAYTHMPSPPVAGGTTSTPTSCPSSSGCGTTIAVHTRSLLPWDPSLRDKPLRSPHVDGPTAQEQQAAVRPHRNQERIPTTPSAFDADGLDCVRATSILLHFLAVKQVAGPEFAPHAAYAHTDPGTCARNGLQRDGSEVRTPATGSVRATSTLRHARRSSR